MKRKKVAAPKWKTRAKKPLPVVWVEFMDHSHTTGSGFEAEPLKCEVFGVLYKEDDEAYYVASWITASELDNNNNECFCILKAVVTDYQILG